MSAHMAVMDKLTPWLGSITANHRIPLDVLLGYMDLTKNENVQKLIKGCIDPDDVASRVQHVPIHKIPTLVSFSSMLDPSKQEQLSKRARKNYLMCLKIKGLQNSQLKLANHIKLALGAAMMAAFDAVGMDTRVITCKPKVTREKQTGDMSGGSEERPGKRARVTGGGLNNEDNAKDMERVCNRIYELENAVYNLTEELRSFGEMKAMMSTLLACHNSEFCVMSCHVEYLLTKMYTTW